MTGCTVGSCASFDGIDSVSVKMSSDAEETLMRSSHPVKFISKVILTESEFFSRNLCKQIVDNLFKHGPMCPHIHLQMCHSCLHVNFHVLNFLSWP